jgi:hypothetical protein
MKAYGFCHCFYSPALNSHWHLLVDISQRKFAEIDLVYSPVYAYPSSLTGIRISHMLICQSFVLLNCCDLKSMFKLPCKNFLETKVL